MSTARFRSAARSEAQEKGLRYYRTGKACSHGHYGLRYTVSGKCVQCDSKTKRNIDPDEYVPRPKPEWRPPTTGSISGFIKPIPYSSLVARR